MGTEYPMPGIAFFLFAACGLKLARFPVDGTEGE